MWIDVCFSLRVMSSITTSHNNEVRFIHTFWHIFLMANKSKFQNFNCYLICMYGPYLYDRKMLIFIHFQYVFVFPIVIIWPSIKCTSTFSFCICRVKQMGINVRCGYDGICKIICSVLVVSYNYIVGKFCLWDYYCCRCVASDSNWSNLKLMLKLFG